MDRKDEKNFLSIIKAKSFEAGDRVIRMQTIDRGLYVVISGVFFGMDDSFPEQRKSFGAGAILGIDQFLENDRWDSDIICKMKGSIMGKIEYDMFEELREKYPQSAIRFYNRVIRYKSCELIRSREDNAEKMRELVRA